MGKSKKTSRKSKTETMPVVFESSVKHQKSSSDNEEIHENQTPLEIIKQQLEILQMRVEADSKRLDVRDRVLSNLAIQLSESEREKRRLMEECVKLKMELTKLKYNNFKIGTPEFESTMSTLMRQQGR